MSDAIIIYLLPVLPFLSACAFFELWRRNTAKSENLGFALAFGLTGFGYMLAVTATAQMGRAVVAVFLLIFSLAAVAYNWSVIRRLGKSPPTKLMISVSLIGCACVGILSQTGQGVAVEMLLANSTIGILFLIGTIILGQVGRKTWLDKAILVIWGFIAFQSFVRPPLSFALNGPLSMDTLVSLQFHAVLFWFLGFLGLLLSVVLFTSVVKDHISDVEERFSLDPLTEAKNRKFFEHEVNLRLNSSRKANSTFSLIVCDLDNFKRINDKWGHQVGDRVLKKFADTVRASMRRGDSFGRIGGEEFCIFVESSHPTAGHALAQRIRMGFAEQTIDDSPSSECLSSSFGVADIQDGETYASAFSRADTALYAAKAEGKDTVVIAPVSQLPSKSPAPKNKVHALPSQTAPDAHKAA
ncbi:MAG: GGDEF domain-containing protein [Erythrobacter sp.]|uniref:GGDEF domain-containing protein n=1 Tax=Erythrobacter sp. TaxID=1042 RepID=UPI003299E5CB